MITKEFCETRIKEQNDYITLLKVQRTEKFIDEERYKLLFNSAFQVKRHFEDLLFQMSDKKEEAYNLLRECQFALNSIKNQRYGEKDTYWLVSQIDKYFENEHRTL